TVGVRPGGLNDHSMAHEVWSNAASTTPLRGEYHGSTTTGEVYSAWETASLNSGSPAYPWIPGGSYLDIRPLKIVHLKDGILSSEVFSYDVGNIAADIGFRTWGN